MAWARTHTQSDLHLLALVVWLKCYQRLGYFPPAAAIPGVGDRSCARDAGGWTRA
jgi:hypothetical protein